MIQNLSMHKISSTTAIKITNVLILLSHIFYLAMFYALGDNALMTLNIFSVCIYIFITAISFYDDENLKISLAITQFEIVIHATLCFMRLGWGYGFELLFFAFIFTSLFTDIRYKVLTNTLIFTQICIFFGCYYLFYDGTVKYEGWENTFFISNAVVACCFAIIVSRLLELSNTLAFINARQEKVEIEEILNQDPLTKLQNRNALNAFVKENLNDERDFAVVICDIDDFKRINDTYGHNAGDKVLINIAEIFKNIFRKDDFVCRWGGEEFLIILCDSTNQKALSVLERVRNSINSSHILYEDTQISVTMTYGVSCYEKTKEQKDIYTMIKEADERLYKGKRSGKNCIVDE
ncbi:GGDEF domain-containing protein [Campylobacter mucosalis]|uniref:GGDEF domain-containing protein n=1 Tax=Campylobacter mucosalis TaxID=202 RepID=UPI0014701C78|nr:GGDEF domain-containing protein [Campylobacter mucosalis]